MKFLKKKNPNKLCSSSVGKKTCPEGGQESTGALKARQNPPRKGAPGLCNLYLGASEKSNWHKHPDRRLGTSILLWASLREQAKPVPHFENRNQTFNPGQAGVKPDN